MQVSFKGRTVVSRRRISKATNLSSPKGRRTASLPESEKTTGKGAIDVSSRHFSLPAEFYPSKFEPRTLLEVYLFRFQHMYLLSSLYRRSAIYECVSHWPEILPLPANMANLASVLDLQMPQPRPRDQSPRSPPAKLDWVDRFQLSQQNGSEKQRRCCTGCTRHGRLYTKNRLVMGVGTPPDVPMLI